MRCNQFLSRRYRAQVKTERLVHRVYTGAAPKTFPSSCVANVCWPDLRRDARCFWAWWFRLPLKPPSRTLSPGGGRLLPEAAPQPRPGSPPATRLPAISPPPVSATPPLRRRSLPPRHLPPLIPGRCARSPSGRAHAATARASRLAGQALARRLQRRSQRLISKGLVVAAGAALGRSPGRPSALWQGGSEFIRRLAEGFI